MIKDMYESADRTATKVNFYSFFYIIIYFKFDLKLSSKLK